MNRHQSSQDKGFSNPLKRDERKECLLEGYNFWIDMNTDQNHMKSLMENIEDRSTEHVLHSVCEKTLQF